MKRTPGLANFWPREWPFIKSIKYTALICQSVIPKEDLNDFKRLRSQQR